MVISLSQTYTLPRILCLTFRWTDYQVVSYILSTKRGNRTQFENMVSTCSNAGVGIIVDGAQTCFPAFTFYLSYSSH